MKADWLHPHFPDEFSLYDVKQTPLHETHTNCIYIGSADNVRLSKVADYFSLQEHVSSTVPHEVHQQTGDDS